MLCYDSSALHRLSAVSQSGFSSSIFRFLLPFSVVVDDESVNSTKMIVMLSQPDPSPLVSGAKQASNNWKTKEKKKRKERDFI